MIRVFKPTDRDFTSNGDAVIVPIKARVKNNMNGEFFIELTCESKFYKYLDQGNIIITPTPQGEQAFRIDNQLSRKGERITIKARHVFYDAEKLVVADSYAVDLNCEQALKHFNAATDSTSPFTMHSDITSLNSFRCVRKSLAEAIGTVIERWGGYLVRNNWDISVNKSVGRDYGVTIRYAKNLKELTASYDFSGVATKLLPVGKDGILLPELYVSSSKQYSIPYTKVVSIQQDINEDDYSTEEEYQAAVIADLRTQAQALVNKTCIPVITYTLKGNPEKVQDIGDVIEVIDERIGVNITTQVIGYEWDVITEQYASITFGNFGNTLSGLMAKVNADTKGVVNEAVGEVKTEFKSSINNIYDLLQGSYVLYRGYDILLLDRIPAGTAQNIIKFSKDGISVSSDGINGDFKEVYNIATKKLSVPSISLNGKDLQNTLDDKISYDNLKEGNNITITRKGKILTINSTGKNGNTVLAGLNVPADSLGDEHDLYLKLSGANEDVIQDYSEVGGGMVTYEVTKNSATNYNFFQQINGVPSWDHISYPLHGLIAGNTYNVTFTQKFTNGQFYGGYNDTITIENGEENITADLYPDNESHDFSLTFIAGVENTLTFSYPKCVDGVLIDSNITNFNISGLFINGIKDIYGKVDGKWQIYEPYEAGDNITIVDGVINATDTDEIAELDDVSLTNLADGEILKYNATTQKWENAEDSGGSEVEANPSGTATNTLTKLGIDGTVYELQGGGDGSTYFGVFVDTQNVILPKTRYVDGDSYTATQNCYGFICYQLGSGKTQITLDGVDLVNISGVSNIYSYIVVNLAKGQTINFISTFSGSFYLTVYGVKSGSEASYFQPIIYSTEEREVGVWVDNKPLYEKTIKSTYTKGSSWTTITHNISDIENIVDCEAFVVDQGTMYEVPQYRDSSMYFIVGVNSSVVYYINTWLDSGGDISITLRYTKTADVAGSGSYTTLGVPAHHYDSNEKIVGTWFGKTLYEKTFIQQLSDNYAHIDISGLNADIAFLESGFYDIGVTKLALNEIIDINGRVFTYTHINAGSEYLYIDCKNFVAATSTAYITMRYTKNT